MPILFVEKRNLERARRQFNKHFKRLGYLYELVEWGGLSSEEWEELHKLELKLELTAKLLFGACTHAD